MKEPRRSLLLYHAGTGVFSIFPAALLFLTVQALAGSLIWASVSAVVLILLVQLLSHLTGSGVLRNPLPLRFSYWTLKILQSLHMVKKYVPERMVVAVNNRGILSARRDGFTPESTLVLLPHCLQHHECPIRLTFDPQACRRCGKCPLGDLVQTALDRGVRIAIASGGTGARRVVRETRPGLIIAVACPVDLSLGIMDVHPIPTVGVLNSWPNGPCMDTWVDPEQVSAALDLFLED